jgi:hypothetical protein
MASNANPSAQAFGENYDSKIKKTANPSYVAANKTDPLLEKKRASLDVRHRFLIDKSAEYFDEKPANIENSLLVGNKLDLVNDFFAEGGTKKVIFIWATSSKVISNHAH